MRELSRRTYRVSGFVRWFAAVFTSSLAVVIEYNEHAIPEEVSPTLRHRTLHHHLQHLPAKHTVIFSIFDQLRVDIFDQEEYGVHDRLHIYPVWDLLLSMA